MVIVPKNRVLGANRAHASMRQKQASRAENQAGRLNLDSTP